MNGFLLDRTKAASRHGNIPLRARVRFVSSRAVAATPLGLMGRDTENGSGTSLPLRGVEGEHRPTAEGSGTTGAGREGTRGSGMCQQHFVLSGQVEQLIQARSLSCRKRLAVDTSAQVLPILTSDLRQIEARRSRSAVEHVEASAARSSARTARRLARSRPLISSRLSALRAAFCEARPWLARSSEEQQLSS